MTDTKRVGVLTGGGDAPGLNPAIKGLVVYEAGDYGQARGLRSPSGRLREATIYVMSAMRALREATITTPTP